MKFSTNRIASENEKYEKNGKQTINFYNFSEQTSSNRDEEEEEEEEEEE